MADTEKKSLSKDHEKLLYRVRDKNYNTNSPHHVELTKLIKDGDVEGLKAFSADKFLEGPGRDEFDAAVEGKSAPKAKPATPAKPAKPSDDDEF